MKLKSGIPWIVQCKVKLHCEQIFSLMPLPISASLNDTGMVSQMWVQHCYFFMKIFCIYGQTLTKKIIILKV